MLSKNLLTGLHGLFRKKQTDRELDDEVRDYLESAATEKMRSGMGREEALRAARLEMGSMDGVKERVREVGWENAMESLWQDVRYGIRILRKNPAFTAAAVMTLALGIGANTAIFSMVSWLVLRPLPVKNPNQLTYLALPTQAASPYDKFSYAEFLQIEQSSRKVFSGIVALRFGGSSGDVRSDGLTVDEQTRSAETVFVTGNFFNLLGLQPQLGRLLLPSEGYTPSADPVVVLGYQYWESRFNGDPSMVGKKALINGHPVTIVGVAPQGFDGVTPLLRTQAYLPLGMVGLEGEHANELFTDPKAASAIVIGRLRDGISVRDAEANLAGLSQQFAKDNPRPGAMPGLLVKPLRPPGLISGPNPLPGLTVLFLTLAGLVLLLAGLNVTNLLLVRATLRQHEMAVRFSLGATRGRLVRQMLTESILLALLGAAGGLCVGMAAAYALRSIPIETELPLNMDFRLDWRVFLYTVLVSLIAGAVMGITAALRTSSGRISQAQALHASSRSFSGDRQRLRSALVAVQVGGSLALLIAAGLFVRSLRGAERSDLGFNPHNVLNVTTDPRQIGYTQQQSRDFYLALLNRVRALPRAQSASLAMDLPLGDLVMEVGLQVPGYTAPKDHPPSALCNLTSPDFFRTNQIPLLRGRDFTSADNEKSPTVAVINQAMAERFWPHQDAIGRHFVVSTQPRQTAEVIGVARNIHVELSSPFQPTFYLPAAQRYAPVLSLQVRTTGDPLTIVADIRSIVVDLAPTMPVYGVRTMDRAIHGMSGLFLFEIGAELAGALGLLGLTLAIVGVYGVISYSVSRRTQEIGIRMALGAKPVEILRMICRQSALIIAASVPLGLFASFALAKLLGDFLVGVSPLDPFTYTTVTLLLISIALFAGYLPARRATQVNPMIALRHE